MKADLKITLIRVAAIVYAAAVVIVSVLPSGDGAIGGWAWDEGISTPVQKCGHVACYALLVVMVAWAIRPAGPHTPWLLGLIALGSVLLGLALELAQTVIPGRTGSARDVMLNTVGAAAGVALTVVLQFLVRRSKAKAGPPDAPAAGTGPRSPGAPPTTLVAPEEPQA